MDTFRAPPRPLPYDDPRFSPPTVQHPIVSEHDKASTHFQKPGQITERKNTDTASTCTSQKVDGSSVKHHSGGSRIDGIQASDSSDNEDDCPICLDGWWKPLALLSLSYSDFCSADTGFTIYRFECLACMNKRRLVKPCDFSYRRKYYMLIHLNHSKYGHA